MAIKTRRTLSLPPSFEYDLANPANVLEPTVENIAIIKERPEGVSDFENRYDEVNDEFEASRTKTERIEQQAIEEVNEHMDALLELVEYENLERIWLEREDVQGIAHH